MPEKKTTQIPLEELQKKVNAGTATDDELRAFFTMRDLAGLPSERVYELESHFTKEWDCEYCGSTGIPCAVDCPQCGHGRIKENFDKEQEGRTGKFRKMAGWRETD